MCSDSKSFRVVLILSACFPRTVVCSCDLPRLNIDDPRALEKFRKNIKGKRAALIDGLAENWPALQWDLDTWKANLANVSLPLWDPRRADASGTYYRVRTIVGRDLFENWQNSNSSEFIFRAKGHDSVSLFLEGMGAIKIPHILEDVYLNSAISIGGKDGGLEMFHAHEEAWLTLAIGKKQWYVSSEEVQSIHAPTVVACTQIPGQTVYVPEYFWHSTGNVRDETVDGGLVIGVGGQGGSPGVLGRVVHGDVQGLAEAVKKANGKMDPMLLDGATSSSRLSTLRWLLQHDAPTSSKSLPIHIAAKFGHCDVLDVLEEERPAHFNIEAIDNEGNRALHLAAWTGHVDVLRWLSAHGVDIHSFGNNGHVAIAMSSFHGHADFVSSLVDLRASVESTSRQFGIRALHMAAFAGNTEIASLLLEHRANVHATSAKGQPAHISADSGHLDMLKLLVQHRSDLISKFNGSTVVQIATSRGHKSIAKWINQHTKLAKAKPPKAPSPVLPPKAPSPVLPPKAPSPVLPGDTRKHTAGGESSTGKHDDLIIHVAYSSTAKGFEMLLSSIASLGRHLKKPWQCLIHLIVPEDDLKAALTLRRCAVNGLSKQPLNVLVYKQRALPFQIKKNTFFTKQQADDWNSFANTAAFTKLFLHEYLPMVSKVLYLDIDTIVRSDITSLYMTPMKHAIAAVRSRYDQGQLKEGLQKVGKLRNLTGTYFQSGVVLVDLLRWRSENISQQVVEWGQKSLIGWAFAEQVALNAAVQGNYDQLDWWWNVRVDPEQGPRLLDDVDPKHYQPKIFHFFNQIKCWRSYCGKTAAERKFDYLYEYPKQQCFRDLFPHAFIEDDSSRKEL